MLNLKRNLLSVALASATLMVATGVQAQTAPRNDAGDQDAEQLDSVVVTGIRASIEKSIDTKKEETAIVEAISSEDLGRLPDASIADSLARLPGLTAQRFGGRPSEINIRGFSGDYSTTTLNGREQVSLGNNRGVEFDQYPSELTSQVVVYKTQDASLIGQGLSGTVDLRTVRPLAFDDRVVAVNLRGDMNDRDGSKNYGNRGSISYIDQFADRTVGIALGYAKLNNPVQEAQFESWGYDGGLLGGGKLYEVDTDNERDGFMGVLEFRPSDIFTTRLDVFYSKFDKIQEKTGMEFGLAWGSAVQSRTNNADGTAVQATFNNFKPVIRNDYNAENDKLFSFGWNSELELGESWTLTTDVSTSSAKREQRILETYAGLRSGLAGDTVSINFNPDGYFDFDFGYDYSDPNILRLTDAGGWGQDGYIKDFEVRDSIDAIRVDLERSFNDGWLSSIEFGVNLTERTKSRGSDESFLCLRADCSSGAALPIPTQFSNGSGFNFASLNGLYGYNALQAFESLYFRRPNANNADINQKNWEVEESVATGYFQANLDMDLGTTRLRGNFGLQAINVDQHSTGVLTFQGVTLADAGSRGSTYTDFLPSLNLTLELPADQRLRFGAGKQLARPRMDHLRANAGLGVNNNETNPATCAAVGLPAPCVIFQGDGGNPELRPWEAHAYDLSYEKYFADNRGYLSAGLFYKDLKTYIIEDASTLDYSQLPLPPIVGPVPTTPIGPYRAPVNREGGTVQGYELAVSLPFDILWSPLRGFGFTANYSYVESEITPFGPDTDPVTLPGLSKHIANASFYYERYGFSARVNSRTRSRFIGEVQGFGGDRYFEEFKGERVTDLQLGYEFGDGSLDGLSILFQVNNLENTPFTQEFDRRADRPRKYFEYGRTYLFGVNYRF